MRFGRIVVCALMLGVWNVSEAEQPNILLAISDDQSWMHTGANGDSSLKTPAFDRVAREGVRFVHSFASAPSCAPSRASILTGRHIYELEEGGILFGLLKPKFAVFPLLLQEAGYELAATGKTYAPGQYADGFSGPVFGKQFNTHKLENPPPGINPIDYASNFDEFFAGRDKEKPFFFWFGATEPHQSYDIGGWQKHGKKLEDALLPGPLPDHPVTRGEILDYGVEIEHFDRHLARMIEVLEKAGELDNTLIVVTSDHGNPLPRSKCNLYDSGTRVPLAFRLPEQIPAGRVVEDFTVLMDLAPTLLETAGLTPPETMTARTLWPVLRSEKSGVVDAKRDFAVTAIERHIIARRDGVGYPMRAIQTAHYAYIRNYEPYRWPAGDPDYNSSHQGFYGDVDRGESKRIMLESAMDPKIRPYFLRSFGRRPAEEFYDLEKDPHQLHNLAEDKGYATEMLKLRQRMEMYLRDTGDPRMRGESPWDEYPFFGGEAIYENPAWRTEGRPSPLVE
jgi:N-sulfoglucosamine sulfohydrolase